MASPDPKTVACRPYSAHGCEHHVDLDRALAAVGCGLMVSRSDGFSDASRTKGAAHRSARSHVPCRRSRLRAWNTPGSRRFQTDGRVDRQALSEKDTWAPKSLDAHSFYFVEGAGLAWEAGEARTKPGAQRWMAWPRMAPPPRHGLDTARRSHRRTKAEFLLPSDLELTRPRFRRVSRGMQTFRRPFAPDAPAVLSNHVRIVDRLSVTSEFRP